MKMAQNVERGSAWCSVLEVGLSLLGIGQSHHGYVLFGPGISPGCALTLQAGSTSVYLTQGIFLPHFSLSSIALVHCHTKKQIGNIGFTCPCGDCYECT